jgi:hypothetical protein
VLDLRTLTLAAQVEPGRAYLNMALTLDGRYLHLTAEGPGRDQMRQEGLDSCDDPCIDVLIDVMDVETLAVVSRAPSKVGVYPVSKWDPRR